MEKGLKRLLAASHLVLACISASAQTTDQENNTLLNEVLVVSEGKPTNAKHISQITTVVEREQLLENERTNILPTLVEQVPGLMITSRGVMGYGLSGGGSGGMMLRGISSGAGQVLVLVDGHPQYNGIYGHSIADAYQTMMTEKVEILRGPASLLYGSNAMGGVINIVTRNAKKDGVYNNVNIGAGSYGTAQIEASNQVRSGKFSSTVAGQYSRTDNHRPNMGFEQFGGYAKVNYDITNNWNVYLNADVTHFNASYPGTVTAPMAEADQWITRGVVSAGIENHFTLSNGRATNGRLSIYDNFGRHKINDGYITKDTTKGPQKNLFRSTDALIGANWFQTANLWRGNLITVGADYQHITGHTWYTDRKTGEEVINGPKQSDDQSNDEMAGYINMRQAFTQWLALNAGVRYDHHTITGGEWVPQAGIDIRPIHNGEITFMASKGFRNPTMKEMYLYPPSNTDLSPERLWNYEVAWKHSLLDGRLTYGVNVFYLKAKNIIQMQITQVPGSDEKKPKNVNTGELENKGAEMDLNYRINQHWSVNTNHSYLDMENPVLAAPTYKGFFGAALHYGRFGANIGLQYVNDLYTQTGAMEIKESFTLLNAGVNFQACKWLNLWAKGDNLLAQEYEYMVGMPMPKATFMGGLNIAF